MCFPSGKDGKHTPLPKQLEFLRLAVDPSVKAPKYITYVGGIGSGKTLIGCVTLLTWALQYPGDYLVGRQFMPELKVTTLKTFIEICPPQLIVEHRVADNMIKVKSVGGKTSTIYFRQLEEPDKFRSMNLSGFLIDEANQVSEEAFLLLQGRLRGNGLRKGIIVSNPAGHDWLYRWFFLKDHLKNDIAKAQYRLIRAPSTENIHLPEGYLESLKQAWSEDRIKREIEGSFDAFEGAVYSEFRRDVHVIKPFAIPTDWPKYIGIDHGYRNPAAWVWCAVGPDGEIYVYREFYQREWLINEIINGKVYNKSTADPGTMQLNRKETITYAVIDPSTRNRRGSNGESDLDEYLRHLPKEFPLGMAKNDKTLGIDRVKSYLKINPKSNKPLLYIFETCTNLLEEMTQYRYQELRPGQEDKRGDKEEPYKVNDHALDALRYVVMLLPEPYVDKFDAVKHLPYNSSARRLYDDIQRMKKPKIKDPFGDF